jgi:regulator of protease activity HflC (stomatin/prohibitin superfamily)
MITIKCNDCGREVKVNEFKKDGTCSKCGGSFSRVNNKNSNNNSIPNGKQIFSICLIVFVIILLFSSFYTIPAGKRGIILTFQKPSDNVVSEGLHFKIPFIQQIVKVDIKTMKYESTIGGASKDLQVISGVIATNYHLESDSLVDLYKSVGLGYEVKIIQPLEQEVSKSVTARYTAEELITRREEVRLDIKQGLYDRLIERGIIVEEVSIVNFDFSASFNAAIENKVTMEQNALAAKNKLEQVKYEADQKIAEANGKAQAMSIESAALRENPDILQLRAIEKWDGKLSLVASNNAMPFIGVNTATNTI